MQSAKFRVKVWCLSAIFDKNLQKITRYLKRKIALISFRKLPKLANQSQQGLEPNKNDSFESACCLRILITNWSETDGLFYKYIITGSKLVFGSKLYVFLMYVLSLIRVQSWRHFHLPQLSASFLDVELLCVTNPVLISDFFPWTTRTTSF